jgi:hypothetical protein
MNKYILGGGLLVAVLILTFSYLPTGTDSAVPMKVASAITVVEEPHDFGDIDIFAGKVRTDYTLMNEGTEDVTVRSAQTSCMCTEGVIGGLSFGMHESDVKDVVIPAGGKQTLTAIYDPLAHGPNGTGKVTRELMLATNSEVTPVIKVKFSANVVKNEE